MTARSLFGGKSESTAVLSPDGLYRYNLTRTWGNGPIATFLMCNPSKADASVNDPTIVRCIGFARSWGCDGIDVGNAYGLRSTDPKGLWLATDPVGPDNDDWLIKLAANATVFGWPVVAAWGANVKPARVAQILALPGMGALQALGVTKAGAPRHPLYLRGDAKRVTWPVAS
jgi:hypothetical protein